MYVSDKWVSQSGKTDITSQEILKFNMRYITLNDRAPNEHRAISVLNRYCEYR